MARSTRPRPRPSGSSAKRRKALRTARPPSEAPTSVAGRRPTGLSSSHVANALPAASARLRPMVQRLSMALATEISVAGKATAAATDAKMVLLMTPLTPTFAAADMATSRSPEPSAMSSFGSQRTAKSSASRGISVSLETSTFRRNFQGSVKSASSSFVRKPDKHTMNARARCRCSPSCGPSRRPSPSMGRTSKTERSAVSLAVFEAIIRAPTAPKVPATRAPFPAKVTMVAAAAVVTAPPPTRAPAEPRVARPPARAGAARPPVMPSKRPPPTAAPPTFAMRFHDQLESELPTANSWTRIRMFSLKLFSATASGSVFDRRRAGEDFSAETSRSAREASIAATLRHSMPHHRATKRREARARASYKNGGRAPSAGIANSV
mmetsp:Transcript_49676/g.108083  ORF Transcript_49676/g.108083 Transcript_49676/m.108083 type:complete len:380 (+) Transcript_49676:282-1421(+)